MLSGAMQGGHTGVAECIFAGSVREAVSQADPGLHLLLDNVVGSVRFSSIDCGNGSVTLAIGPERGWSEGERRLFLESGFIPTVMGNHILRTEKAAVAAVAIALERKGKI